MTHKIMKLAVTVDTPDGRYVGAVSIDHNFFIVDLEMLPATSPDKSTEALRENIAMLTEILSDALKTEGPMTRVEIDAHIMLDMVKPDVVASPILTDALKALLAVLADLDDLIDGHTPMLRDAFNFAARGDRRLAIPAESLVKAFADVAG